MGKINEIEKERMQSYGSNALKTVIEDDKVVFDADKDVIEFKDDIKIDGKLLKKRGEQPIYDEIKSIEVSSSYTSGQQIATVSVDGKTKPLYIRESIYLDGVFSPNRQLWFKMDEQNGELFVSFDKGANWKKIVIEN